MEKLIFLSSRTFSFPVTYQKSYMTYSQHRMNSCPNKPPTSIRREPAIKESVESTTLPPAPSRRTKTKTYSDLDQHPPPKFAFVTSAHISVIRAQFNGSHYSVRLFRRMGEWGYDPGKVESKDMVQQWPRRLECYQLTKPKPNNKNLLEPVQSGPYPGGGILPRSPPPRNFFET